MSKQKGQSYFAVDELALRRWITARRDEFIRLTAGPAGSNGKPWELETLGSAYDFFVVKAQLITRGKLFPRKLQLATELAAIGESLGLRFQLFEKTTATTLVYHASPADLAQFRTVRLTGRAAREMRLLDDQELIYPNIRRFQRALECRLAERMPAR